MRIDSFRPLTYTLESLQRAVPEKLESSASEPLQRPTVESTGTSNTSGFGEQISGALDHVNTLQNNADELVNQVASGNPEDAHKAVIAMEHALMAMDFTLQVRNKVLDAYQEIMKTQL